MKQKNRPPSQFSTAMGSAYLAIRSPFKWAHSSSVNTGPSFDCWMVRPIFSTLAKIEIIDFWRMRRRRKIASQKVPLKNHTFSSFLNQKNFKENLQIKIFSAVKNLHFYNAPSSITLDELAHISQSFCINPPSKIRRFKEMQDKGIWSLLLQYRIKLLRFFEDIFFSRTNSYGT